MKNLHKKIGAVALAGMVVFGGFAASGVSAHANSNSVSRNRSEQRLGFYCKFLRYDVVESSSSRSQINKYARRYQGKHIYGGVVGLDSSNIFVKLDSIFRGNWEVVRVKYEGMYYLLVSE